MLRILLHALTLAVAVQATPITLEQRGANDDTVDAELLIEAAQIMQKHLESTGVRFALAGGASMYFLDDDTIETRASGDLDWTVEGTTRQAGLDVQAALLRHNPTAYKDNPKKSELLFLSPELDHKGKPISIPTTCRIGEADKPLKQLTTDDQILHLNGVNILHPLVQINKKCDGYKTKSRATRAQKDSGDVTTLVKYLVTHYPNTRYAPEQFDSRCFKFKELRDELERLPGLKAQSATGTGSPSRGGRGSANPASSPGRGSSRGRGRKRPGFKPVKAKSPA